MSKKQLDASDVLKILKEVQEENEQLKLRNKQYSMMVNTNSDLNDEIYEQLQKTEKALKRVYEENKQLKEEKEFWKGDACNYSNYLSILSMDCQIVQEAICDLKNVIDVDTEAFKLLDELDDKFDKLVQHRIKMYSR